MSSEPFEQSDAGYPEEGPPGSQPDDDPSSGGESAVREKSRPDQDAPDNDDGKATGNPNSAG
jgi:hypothetical protein